MFTPSSSDGEFGSSVAIFGLNALIGAPSPSFPQAGSVSALLLSDPAPVCNASYPVQCLSGACVTNSTQCLTAAVCPNPSAPFLCSLSQTCNNSPSSCSGVAFCPNSMKCWDGSCAASLDQCPPVPACPVNYTRYSSFQIFDSQNPIPFLKMC